MSRGAEGGGMTRAERIEAALRRWLERYERIETADLEILFPADLAAQIREARDATAEGAAK